MEEKEYLNAQEKVQGEEAGEETETKKRSFLRELLSFAEIFIIAFLLAQLMTRFVLINAEVPDRKSVV